MANSVVPDKIPTATEQTPLKEQSSLHSKSVRYLQIFVLCLGTFFSGTTIALPGPFLPIEGHRKGVSATKYGLSYTLYALAFGIAGILPNYLKRYISLDAQLMIFTFLSGLMTAINGLATYVLNTDVFVVLVCICRTVEGAATSIALVTVFAVVPRVFPSQPGLTVTFILGSASFGILAGPFLGGVLFEVGGFGLPFYVCGGCLALSALAIAFIFHRYPGTDPSETSGGKASKDGMLELLWDVDLQLDYALILLVYMVSECNITALEPHLRQYHMRTVLESAMFSIPPLAQILLMPFLGAALDNTVYQRLYSLLSLLFIMVYGVLIGPAGFLPLQGQVWTAVVALASLGAGFFMGHTSAYVHAVRQAEKRGFTNEVNTHAMLSGYRNVILSLGCILGSLVGGAGVDALGFINTILLLALATAILFLCTLLAFGVELHRERLRGQDISS